MKFCYLILAYRFPVQLKKLIDAIYAEDSLIYIHLDIEKDLNKLRGIIGPRKNVYYLEKRVKCIWGHRSMVDAELLLLEATRGLAKYYVLLSDQHYPVKHPRDLWRYMEDHNLAAMIEISEMESPQKLRNRIESLFLFYGKKRDEYIRIPPMDDLDFYKPSTLLRILKAARKGQFRKLRLLLNIPKLGIDIKWGSQWWVFNDDTVASVIQWTVKNPLFYQNSEHKFIVDEYFFHSIIYHLKLEGIRFKTSTFVRRDPLPPFEYPELFKSEDVETFDNLPEHVFFARKFDYEEFPGIVDRLQLKLNHNHTLGSN